LALRIREVKKLFGGGQINCFGHLFGTSQIEGETLIVSGGQLLWAASKQLTKYLTRSTTLALDGTTQQAHLLRELMRDDLPTLG
jgi:hypothetical protein